MPDHDDRIDAYIAKAAPFARPILELLGAVVHAACPAAEETLKWSAPHFTLNGRILAGMAAFKQHAAFVVPMLDTSGGEADRRDEAMGHYGRITALGDLPPRRTLVAQLKAAAKAIDAGDKRPAGKRKPAGATLEMPADFTAALADAPAARTHFDGFTPGKQREYVAWIIEAKQATTRTRRIAQAVEWIAEGKARHWKYETC